MALVALKASGAFIQSEHAKRAGDPRAATHQKMRLAAAHASTKGHAPAMG